MMQSLASLLPLLFRARARGQGSREVTHLKMASSEKRNINTMVGESHSPAPEPSELEAPSVSSFHVFSGSVSFLLASPFFSSSLSVGDVSIRKSASICPLIEFLPLNSISCSPNSMAHLATRPDFSWFFCQDLLYRHVTDNLYWVHLEISSELPCGVHEGKYELFQLRVLFSALCSVRLTKYTGSCFFPLSAINTALTFLFEAARYTVNVSPLVGITIVGSDSKHSFILRKASFASVVH
ncbi:hypothetical protein Tco_0891557 [Tanacetum coccineum]|uniref:Secreted protein n=1 Tax=Tanacetum coccineum TaxID=301880 RepID=A0ABQ5C3K5_9ASTR